VSFGQPEAQDKEPPLDGQTGGHEKQGQRREIGQAGHGETPRRAEGLETAQEVEDHPHMARHEILDGRPGPPQAASPPDEEKAQKGHQLDGDIDVEEIIAHEGRVAGTQKEQDQPLEGGALPFFRGHGRDDQSCQENEEGTLIVDEKMDSERPREDEVRGRKGKGEAMQGTDRNGNSRAALGAAAAAAEGEDSKSGQERKKNGQGQKGHRRLLLSMQEASRVVQLLEISMT
jgi:hypothetical protein